jgi:hypothetical protein
MWRRHAARWAATISAVVLIAACVAWAVAAQDLVTPACALPTPLSNTGPLVCPTP